MNRKNIIERFADLNIHGTQTDRLSAKEQLTSNRSKPKTIPAGELFGNGPIDHDAHTNCSCHPKE